MFSRNASASSSTASSASLSSTGSASSFASSSSSCSSASSSSSSLATTVSSASSSSSSGRAVKMATDSTTCSSSPASYSWSASSEACPSSASASSVHHPRSSAGGIAKRRASPSNKANKVSTAVRRGTPGEVVLEEARKHLAREQAAPSVEKEKAKQGSKAKEYATLQSQMTGLCELQYMDDVKEYMYEMEAKTKAAVETIDMQPELQWYMRPYLLDFLIEIHQQYRLRPETLYLAVNIIDRYVSKRIVFKKHYQLVGCASLWIAAKFEDAKDRVPTVQDLSAMCCGAYDESAFIQMEGHVLSTIGWVLGHPTAEAWLRLRCVGGASAEAKAAVGVEEQKTQHVARFLMEITLFHRAFVGLPASDIAAASLLLARFVVGRSRRHSDETPAVLEIVGLIDAHLSERLDSVSAIVIKKYSFDFYSRAGTVTREFYLSGDRFSLERWNAPRLVLVKSNVSSDGLLSPTSPRRPQVTPLSTPGAGNASSSSSFISSPASSIASCGMTDLRSPSTSSDGGGMDEDPLNLAVDGDAEILDAHSSAGSFGCCESSTAVDDCEDDDMTLAEQIEEVEVDDDEDDEPPRYAVACGQNGEVAVKENLRGRDFDALRKQHQHQQQQALRQTWDANVMPMSC